MPPPKNTTQTPSNLCEILQPHQSMTLILSVVLPVSSDLLGSLETSPLHCQGLSVSLGGTSVLLPAHLCTLPLAAISQRHAMVLTSYLRTPTPDTSCNASLPSPLHLLKACCVPTCLVSWIYSSAVSWSQDTKFHLCLSFPSMLDHGGTSCGDVGR